MGGGDGATPFCLSAVVDVIPSESVSSLANTEPRFDVRTTAVVACSIATTAPPSDGAAAGKGPRIKRQRLRKNMVHFSDFECLVDQAASLECSLAMKREVRTCFVYMYTLRKSVSRTRVYNGGALTDS